jgi:hypothetical protein
MGEGNLMLNSSSSFSYSKLNKKSMKNIKNPPKKYLKKNTDLRRRMSGDVVIKYQNKINQRPNF